MRLSSGNTRDCPTNWTFTKTSFAGFGLSPDLGNRGGLPLQGSLRGNENSQRRPGVISKRLSASEISAFASSDKRVINRRAINERWPFRTEKARGGTYRVCQVTALPADIQAARAESLKLALTGLQSRIEPPSKHEKKVILANHNARRGLRRGGRAARKRERGKAAGRLPPGKGAARAWDGSGLNAEKFLFEYNEGRIAQDARADLGGKTLCQATLYNWLGKYQRHGGAGLAPKYKGRGGNGASLDGRAKELVWFYYLHKNKPAIAQATRRLYEKDHIEASEHIVYRYVKHERAGKGLFQKGQKILPRPLRVMY
jgi:hypothetical protein